MQELWAELEILNEENILQHKVNIIFLGEIENGIQGVYLGNQGKIGYFFDIEQSPGNFTGNFVCQQTGISKAYFGLIEIIKLSLIHI